MVVGSSTTNLVNSALARRHTLLQKWSFIINEATGGLDVYHIVVNRLEKLAAELQAYKENCLKDLNVSITAEKGLPGTEYGLGSEHFTSQQSNGIRGVENYEEPEGVTGGNLALQATRANVIHDAYAMKTNDRANKRFKSSVEMVVRGQGGRLCRGCNKINVNDILYKQCGFRIMSRDIMFMWGGRSPKHSINHQSTKGVQSPAAKELRSWKA
ncbi:hypothetical protein ACLOJK_001644 [Asimina triloba]